MVIQVCISALLALATKIKAVLFIAEVNLNNMWVWWIVYNQLFIEKDLDCVHTNGLFTWELYLS